MAIAGKITTTLVISFADPSSGEYHLSAEVDGRPTGYNKGVTSFIFGDSPVFLVYYSPGVSITLESSTGSVSGVGTTSVDVVEFIQFANVREASLSKPPSGGVSFTSMGGGGSPTVSGMKVYLSQPEVAVFRAVYTTTGHAYRLSGVSQPNGITELPVLIYIEGTTPT